MFYIAAFRDWTDDPPFAQLFTDDPAALERFAKKYDAPGVSVYECVATLKPGSRKRCLETVASIGFLHSDIDQRGLITPRDTVFAALQKLQRELPFEIRDSGGGYHIAAHLKEQADVDTPYYDRAVAARTAMAELLCADLGGPNHSAALLRKLGTHNSKWGETRECRIIVRGKPIDITELETFLEHHPLPLFERKPKEDKEANKGNDHDTGFDERFNREDRLAELHYPGNIHDYELRCVASLISSGVDLDDAVGNVFDDIKVYIDTHPPQQPWDWDKERRRITRMAYSWVNKHPELAPTLPVDLLIEYNRIVLATGVPLLYWSREHRKWWVKSKTPINAEADTNDATDQNSNQKTDAGKESNKSQDGNWWPTPYSGRPAAQIPLRKHILGKHYILGASSVTASAGGIGKSTLSLLDAVSFRIGRDLLTGEPLEKRYRVWVWNAEDDIDEMERRIAAICAHYGIALTDVMSALFLNSGYDLPLDLAYGNSKSAVVNEPLIERIASRIRERQIDVVILDPLVALHSMSEGDNPGHARLIRTLSIKLAKPCECAVDINAHTRKPGIGQDTLTADDIRGPGAIVYSARSGRILNPMSLGEAEKYTIEAEDRFNYYRLERAKANMAKRGTICWVHMIEMPIANRPDGSRGDIIAVPTLWVPPDAMTGITETVANAIAGEIAKGDYKRDARAGAAWAGRLVGLRCGIDVGTKSGKERAKVILETLIKRGVLAVEIRTDKNRNAREYVVPGIRQGSFK